MPIAEPANELWTAVKAIADPWPPDDEDQVAKLAEDWRKAAETAHLAGTDLHDARRASEQAWRDRGGQVMDQRLAGGVVTLQEQKQGAEQQAVLADRYAQTLINVKNAIVHTINSNLPVYLQLANPIYGPVGLAQQRAFAAHIAQQLQAMVASQTQGLQAPPAAPDADTTLGAVGDIAGAVSAFAGGLALIPVAAPVAAPIAVLAGATALAAHAADMIATGSADDPFAWIGLGGDAIGMIPGARALGEAVASTAPKALDVIGSVIDVGLQAPPVLDLFVDDQEIDDSKDLSGGGTLGKIMAWEAIQRMPH